MMIVMEAIGRGLVVEPYLATVVLGGGFLRLGGSEAQRERLIPKVADGSLTLAFAHLERQARYDLHDVATTARRTDGGGFVLDGAKGVVLHGASADLLVVSARTSGARRDREGITLFLVDPKAPRGGAPWLSDPGRAARGGGHPRRGRVEAGDVLGSWTTACLWSSAWWTSRSPRCAPRRSARWRRCSG
jgi:alkylation response protein AidB-like acyl-CoA dehydrogenase